MSTRTARQEMDRSMDEESLLAAVTEAMTLMGWLWHHVRRSDKAIQQGMAGFPDVCAVRKGRVLLLELKSEGGTVTRDQLAWGLEMPPNSLAVTYLIVYPSDLDAVLSLLR